MTSEQTAQPLPRKLKILVIAENISLRRSGETSLSYHYLLEFRRNQVSAYAICHSRVRAELKEDLSPELFEAITFVPDNMVHRAVYALGNLFHYRIADLVFGQLIHIVTQISMRSIAKQLVRDNGIDIVFQPSPISPKAVSFMYAMGAPVVIGPMCGGLELPPAFRSMDGRWVTLSITVIRHLAGLLHQVIPGKRNAAALIVGNQRTADVLPKGVRGKVYQLVESGVDLATCVAKVYAPPTSDPVRFVFCGRLVDWKGARYAVKAFAPLAKHGGAVMDLVGDGELFDEIAELVAREGLTETVTLHGRVPVQRCTEILQRADVYLMPSLRECGGLSLLEAMGIGLPIVATNWLAPAEYLDRHSAILVDPDSESALVAGFTTAMEKLRDSPDLRRSMGNAARKRVLQGHYDWRQKTDRVLEILNEVRLSRTPS